MELPEDTLVNVTRFQDDPHYVLKHVRAAALAGDVPSLHALSRAIKQLPVMAAFNMRPIGRCALADAVRGGSQAAVHAIVVGFGLTASDIVCVKEHINDPELTDCLDCELLLLDADGCARDATATITVTRGGIVVGIFALTLLLGLARVLA